MKSTCILAFGVALVSLLSCSSHSDKNTNAASTNLENNAPAPIKDENIAKGQVIDKVPCKADSSQSYALYLPVDYVTTKTYPVVFIFDPHGDGKLPVTNYKDLAEKYHFILAGSNNSKNGTAWEDVQKIANTFFNDVRIRYAVNTQRIYCMGFSGGARIANALTMNDGSINGVICAGAAAPAAQASGGRENYYFMAVVGTADFNYVEMKKYDMVDLAGHNIKHRLIEFDGKHEWPPVETMDEAFLWMELNQMRKDPKEKNDSLINKGIQTATRQLQDDLNKKEMRKAYENCRKTINFYENLGDLSYFINTYQNLKTNKEIDNSLQKEEASWAKEENIKKKYMDAVQSKDANWWRQDIAAVNAKIKSAPKEEALIYKRILGFLSLVMYMQTSGALQQKNIMAADHFSKLYLLVDPTNSEAHYLAAELSAFQANHDEAIAHLNGALKNGYKDKSK
ncbi:MAG TPA: hypothetical protein VFF27_17975, partial [Bacteroidia bacterium]|nr:hypothetical protein [Bacteroidia bacterium]